MLKLCSFFQSMLLFFKLCSSKTMANKSKTTFSLIRSRLFLLAIIYNGLWQLWLVLAHHFSERAVSFRSNRLAYLTPFCSLAYERYWDRHGLPWDFRFPYTLVPGPISVLRKLLIPLKHRTTSGSNWDLKINVPVKTQKCSDNYQNMRIML